MSRSLLIRALRPNYPIFYVSPVSLLIGLNLCPVSLLAWLIVDSVSLLIGLKVVKSSCTSSIDETLDLTSCEPKALACLEVITVFEFFEIPLRVYFGSFFSNFRMPFTGV
jgi:hypothetical protein